MVDDEDFLSKLNVYERQYHFGKDRKFVEDREVFQPNSALDIEQNSENSNPIQMVKTTKRMSLANAMTDITLRINNPTEPKNRQDKLSVQLTEFPPLKSEKRFSKGRNSLLMGSIRNLQPVKTVKITSNLSAVVKKFALYIFKEFNLDKDKDALTYQQFKDLVINHNKIFLSYYQGFHCYAWQLDDLGVPLIKIITGWIQSEFLVKTAQGTLQPRFIKYIKNTLFVFKRQKDKVPVQIKNLEGLYLEDTQFEDKKGFIFRHRDGLYPEKSYFPKDASMFEEWSLHLKHLRNKLSIADSYELCEKIGAGNYSIVYKGTEKDSGCNVAVKVVEKFKLSSAEKEVLRDECAVLELCHHPCIAQYKKKIDTKTHIYIITELMEQGDLYDYVKKNDFLQEYEACRVTTQILEALSYLSKMGVIHRDLKPENIMVKLNKQQGTIDRVKIIDFGFAIFRDSLASINHIHKYVGTPNFVAPEILNTQPTYTEKVDMFSLGSIVYYMLRGQYAFQSLFDEEINRMNAECNYSMEDGHWENVSADAKNFIKKLMVNEQKRMGADEALRHPWILNQASLKNLIGKNKKKKYL